MEVWHVPPRVLSDTFLIAVVAVVVVVAVVCVFFILFLYNLFKKFLVFGADTPENVDRLQNMQVNVFAPTARLFFGFNIHNNQHAPRMDQQPMRPLLPESP
ncbi:hypothetical protein BFW01_g9952 [Lasiodiplodia theobromae]|uniref:Uncharacterized protein n=1 Tax=Lasiodiplodia theobromae TaxID=45133 RepID=A0A5N5D5Y6_9PEZI|nr:uncharacterized protein LTHEOB_5148 [Lasiodiplodia theobromae]KAB2572965.1 hypothetical protein DBV05_g8345 [Lasiodiplodia theobromae]KAF4545315.1 hypothetical protein LTHEOB_5148 [Lasiodiplodia theobromae]KAF9639055.1 hypothetical protein BFW01_g9952 [Lasiodiplodia theobromae]